MRRIWLLVVAMVFATAAAAETMPQFIGKSGFALEQPEPQLARRGTYGRTVLTIYSPRLVFWADTHYLQAGDHLVLRLKSPDGGIMAERDLKMYLPSPFFIFVSANRPPLGWKRGTYTGYVEIVRGDQILAVRTDQIALP
jgi:hypothetical protein